MEFSKPLGLRCDVALWVGLLGGATLSMAGCGDSGGGDTTDPTVASDPTTDTTEDDTGTADTTTTTTDATETDPDESSSTGPPPGGLGCEEPVPCDGGIVTEWTRIESTEDADLIRGVTSITAPLEINRTDFECLDFLLCLEDAQDEVKIFGNDLLQDLSGTDSLTSVIGAIAVSDNPVMEDMNGFNGLQQAMTSISISRNDTLTTISGFANLRVIQNDLTIRDNAILMSLEGFYQSLQAVIGQFAVTANASLCLTEVNNLGAMLDPQPAGGSTMANDDSC